MQFTVEDLSSVKKTLHIEIPREMVARELDSAYRQLGKTAKIKGFRPGKVPRSVLERMFKKDVHSDVSSRLIQDSFVDALKKTELEIVGRPQVDPPDLKEDEPYRYDATVEVKPVLGSIDFKGLALEKSVYQVSDQEIDLQLKALQKRLASFTPVEEQRGAQKGDHVLITYEGLKDGKPFVETQKTENFAVTIGDGQILPEFDDGLVGMQVGEDKEIQVQFPADYENDQLAGQKIDFFVSLDQIREEALPDIDDELAKQIGNYKDLAELKGQIRSNLEEGYSKRVEQELNEQIFKALIDKTDFEVPESMVEFELQGIIEEAERSFAYRNQSLEDAGLTREGIAEKYKDTAEKQVRRHLILDAIIRQEEMSLEDAELDEGFDEMAKGFNQPVEQIKQYLLAEKEKLENFKHALLEKKAVKLIIDNGTITEATPADASQSKQK
jgi:trigger factor